MAAEGFEVKHKLTGFRIGYDDEQQQVAKQYEADDRDDKQQDKKKSISPGPVLCFEKVQTKTGMTKVLESNLGRRLNFRTVFKFKQGRIVCVTKHAGKYILRERLFIDVVLHHLVIKRLACK